MSHINDLFDFGERLGIFLIVEAAALSAIAVTSLLLFVAFRLVKKYRTRRIYKKRWDMQPEDASNSYYFISLMLGELVQAMGGVLNIQWIIDAKVTEGSLCTAQGILKQVGDVSVALTSLAIALQTFSVLVLRWRDPWWSSLVVICLIWLFIALNIGISSATHPSNYYGNTGYWCWIGKQYKAERIALEYLWLWIALISMVLIYGAIALVMRGVLVVNDGVHFKVRREQDRIKLDLSDADDEDERRSKAVANLMMFYPLVYALCVFPVSVVRWISFGDTDDEDGKGVTPGATIFASILFSLSGLLNAILYKLTRPEILPENTTAMPDITLMPTTDFSQPSDRGALPDFDFPDEDEESREVVGSPKLTNGSYVSLHHDHA